MQRLVVTRPAAQAVAWVGSLLAQGVPALALPLIAIEPATDATVIRQAWARLPALRFVMFVSGNAVQHFFACRPAALAWPRGLRAGATGPGTAQALREAGLVEADIVQPAAGSVWDAQALWARIGGQPWTGASVLVVRGEQGRDWLAEQWRAAGAEVQFLAAYRRAVPSLDAAQRALLDQALLQAEAHGWLFSSSEAIGNLCAIAPPGHCWSDGRALATHPRIAEAARRAGFGEVRLTRPELAAVITAWHALQHEALRTPSVQLRPL